MPNPTKTLRRLSARIQRRFRTARPGSILILVVALLVLMALIGTAWLSTARIDRFATRQAAANTQIDLLVDGVVNLVKAGVEQDTRSGALRRPAVSTAGPGYGHYDSVQSDPLLGSRTPVLLQDVVVDWAEADALYATTPAQPVYRKYEIGQFTRDAIGNYYVCTQAHTADATNGPPGAFWSIPLPAAAWDTRPVYSALSRLVAFASDDISGSVASFSTRTYLFPDVINFAGNPIFPAFLFFHPGTGQMERVPAADTDGDGIADSLLFRLPVGTLEGLDYYAAVRVIDNGSAINVSTAYKRNDDYLGQPPELQLAGEFFPTNIDITGLLVTTGTDTAAKQFDRLNSFRFSDPAVSGDNPTYASPVNEDGTTRTDIRFLSRYDALWMQLGRRLSNPGYNPAGGRYAALGEGDGGALAFHGGTLINSSSSQSRIESLLAGTIYNSASTYNGSAGPRPGATTYGPSLAFGTIPGPVVDWFDYNFDYFNQFPVAGATTYKTPRALLVTRNGVSNQSPVRSASTGAVETPVTASPVGATPVTSIMEPFGATPTKTASNTVGWNGAAYNSNLAFSVLWRSYWSVMAQEWGNVDTRTPVSEVYRYFIDNPGMANPTQSPGWLLDPYVGTKFTPTFGPVGAIPQYTFAAVADPQNPATMFRSSIRATKDGTAVTPAWDTSTPRLEPDQQLLLRAALAAANNIDQRDLDDDVTVQRIPLTVGTAAAPNAIARVYGHERQPYLTEVYVNTNALPNISTYTPPPVPPIINLGNPAGYIAIEFYNPYSFPIDIGLCKLAAIDRSPTRGYLDFIIEDLSAAGPTNGLSLSNVISNIAGATNPYGSPTIIPPYGYLVLENYLDNADALIPANDPRGSAAKYRPPSSKLPQGKIVPPPVNTLSTAVNYTFVRNLDLIYNREIVLMRTAKAAYQLRNTDVNGDGVAEVNQRTLVYGGIAIPPAVPPTPPPTASELSIQNMVPLDSYDFTGLNHPNFALLDPTLLDSATFVAYAWHYARGAPPSYSTVDHLWQFVYPGRYDANQSETLARPGSTNTYPRYQGTKQAYDTIDPTQMGWQSGLAQDPWETPLLLDPRPTPTLDGGRSAAVPDERNATYPTAFTIQMSNLGWGGPLTPTGLPAYPFGGYARDGDLLQVPFIGAYRIQTIAADTLSEGVTPAVPAARVVYELNSVTIDSTFAEDTDTTDDPQNGVAPVATDPPTYRPEQIGRFNPLADDLRVFARGSLDEPGDTSTGTTIADDERTEGVFLIGYDVVITGGAGQGQVRRITNYFPGTPPEIEVAQPWSVAPDATTTYEIRAGHYYWGMKLFDYVGAGGPQSAFLPDSMSSSATPSVVSLDGTTPTHGLVNINTAPLEVLARVPFADNDADSLTLAQAIVAYRDREVASGRVPFATLMDLYRVPEFVLANDALLLDPAVDPGDAAGDITPPDLSGSVVEDGVRNDFEEQFLLLTRVSNLLTTRSDSFTNYILVQGWRGIGTANPELVVQRRRAFMLDRAGITQTQSDLPVKYFFNE